MQLVLIEVDVNKVEEGVLTITYVVLSHGLFATSTSAKFYEKLVF